MKISDTKRVEKVWGYEIWMANTDLYCGKELGLKKGKRCSLHYHINKDETFYIQKGKVLMEINEEEKVMIPGEAILIESYTKHRFSGLEDSIIIEISTHHKDLDSYRIEGQLSGDVPKEIMEEYGN
jgi:quercetin dioxygenase-like cupin family protein